MKAKSSHTKDIGHLRKSNGNSIYVSSRLKESGFSNFVRRNDRQGSKIVILSSYPPRECGIATFSQDLVQAIEKMFDSPLSISVAALENRQSPRIYPREVSYILHTDDACSYNDFAKEVNGDPRVKAVIIQHEFGLFPEDLRSHFESMLFALKKPVVLVYHTVLPSPDPLHRNHVRTISDAADRVIVMTKNSASILQRDYGIEANQIMVIPHGIHLVRHENKDELKEKYGPKDRIVLSTFGLISRNKSIETSLHALSAVVKKYPTTLFLVLGRTHPVIVEREGERYREELEELVRKYKLENNVQFVNHYLSLEELLEYLQLTDIYLFTSIDPHQAVSGTFSYALGAGCAIVSTPIPHAKEMLGNGCGLLFDFGNSEMLAQQIIRYLDDPVLQNEMGEKALLAIGHAAWENVAVKYVSLIQEISREEVKVKYKLPPVKTNYLEKLTDQFGIIQFSKLSHPDISSGYTLDDNARALIAALMCYKRFGNEKMLKLAEIYLRYIRQCQQPAGWFNNYMDKGGVLSDKNNSTNLEDANGRAIWALGYLLSQRDILPDMYSEIAEEILRRAEHRLDLIQSPRAMSFVTKGLFYCHEINPSGELVKLGRLYANRLLDLYKHNTTDDWKWFESSLTYGNSVIPEALLAAYQFTDDADYMEVAKESFDFLISKTFIDNRISVIPNKGWLHKGEIVRGYGEQPIDVDYTIMALERFYNVFADAEYIKRMKQAITWFYGENHLNQIIYNPCTGGCFDGLEENEVNLNQGAESTICYLIARLIVEPYFYNEDFSNPTNSYTNNRRGVVI